MPAYETVIVGVHDSPTGARAVEMAALLAAETGVKLVLVAAYKADKLHQQQEHGHAHGHAHDTIRDAGAAEAALVKATRSCARVGAVDVASVTGAGDPVEVLLDAVSDHNADLLLVGSHGLATLGGRLLGSVPQDVTREAPCDVMVVHTTTDRWRNLVSRHHRPRVSRDYQRTVVVGVHDSPRSQRAAAKAARIAADGGAKLVLAGVYEPEDRHTVSTASDSLRGESYLVQATFPIELALRDAERLARAEGVTDVERLSVRGDPMHGLLWVADKYKADLLVLGNHQMSGRAAQMLGSISAQVSRKTATHALLVH
jgi:nucleotide-binding universal stress UspA family protein